MKAIYPSSFSPISMGHIDVIKDASQTYEHLYLIVANDETKRYSTNIKDRVGLVEKVLSELNLDNVSIYVQGPAKFIPETAKELGVETIVRGVPSKIIGRREEEIADSWLEKNDNLIFNYIITPKLKFGSDEIIKLIRTNQDYSEHVPKIIKGEAFLLWK